MSNRNILTCITFALGASAVAQSLNIDLGSAASSFGKPGDAYAAASGQAGFWNATSAGTPAILRYLDGSQATTKVVPSGSGFANAEAQNPLTIGDDEKLMDDGARLTGASSSYVFNINGLSNGTYYVYTYALAPDSAVLSNVTVPGSPDGVRSCGGVWPGAHAEGTTFTRHFLNVTTGGIQVVVTPQAASGFLNGLQIVRVAQGITPYCFGTAVACPCGNSGGSSAGCENSQASGGGKLTGAGVPLLSGDTLVLSASQLPPGTNALFFQGTLALTNAAFGDGLLCAGGSITRLAIQGAPGGACSFPGAGDAPIGVAGMVLPAQTRNYQVWYRDAQAFCTPATYNLTNGVSVLWQ
ncbi:MAG: hypothetical protein JNL28_02410 [Planctomycetes bacterium]|nr:hypothetical protein [Planctomycetota bacterium]